MTSVAASSTYHHTFNLMTTIPPSTLSSARLDKRLIQLAPISEPATPEASSSSPYAGFKNLLNKIYDVLKTRGALSSALTSADAGTAQVNGQRKAVRIVLHEFGSLDWGDHVSATVRR